MSQLRYVKRSARKATIVVTAAALVASTLAVTPPVQAAEVPSGDRKVQQTRPEPARRVPVDRSPLPDDGGRWAGPEHATWPAAGRATLVIADSPTERLRDGGWPSGRGSRGSPVVCR